MLALTRAHARAFYMGAFALIATPMYLYVEVMNNFDRESYISKAPSNLKLQSTYALAMTHKVIAIPSCWLPQSHRALG